MIQYDAFQFGNVRASVKTPWGLLENLDLADRDLAMKIIAADKHQLVEGLVAESLFDQILSKMDGVTPLKIETILVANDKKDRNPAFVWVKTINTPVRRYLQALEKTFAPYMIAYSASPPDFSVSSVLNGKPNGDVKKLDLLMKELSSRYEPFKVEKSVRDAERQSDAIQNLLSIYGDDLGLRIALPRLLINCGVQPYFGSVWNLDRVLASDNEIILFEHKHKFPFGRKNLGFGINIGELEKLNKLAEAGIKCIHTIVVKPFWSLKEGSMKMFNDPELRTRTAIIGLNLDRATLAMIDRRPTRTSPKHTTLTGSGHLDYKTIEANEFQIIGVLSDSPQDLAGNISKLALGTLKDPVTDSWLSGLRIE